MDARKRQIDSNTNVLVPTLVFFLPRPTLGWLPLPPRVALRQRKWDLAGEPLSPWSGVPSGPPPSEQGNRKKWKKLMAFRLFFLLFIVFLSEQFIEMRVKNFAVYLFII